MAVQRVRATANDVVALGRGRLHEQEQSSIPHDRGDGVDAWSARSVHGGEVGGHGCEPLGAELGEFGSLCGELAPGNADALADALRPGIVSAPPSSRARGSSLRRRRSTP